MSSLIKKILFSLIFNSSLFLVLIISIQNSTTKKKVDLIISETISLPISFIIGTSLISGSLTGNILQINFTKKKT